MRAFRLKVSISRGFNPSDQFGSSTSASALKGSAVEREPRMLHDNLKSTRFGKIIST
ncbi:MAG: hypothetical protein H8E63_04345 [Proteobacteria bacterium]|jgi:hypothetical protein|nr:hypothetical protein [Pseudomonadota bacterium]